MTQALIPGQKYRFTAPWMDEHVEQLDEMLEDLFKGIRLSAIGGAAGTLSGLTGFTKGDTLYASDAAGTISGLAAVAGGSILSSTGVLSAPAWNAAPTLSTSLTTPLIIGGTAAASTLTLRSTSGVGTTDAIIFQVGNNGATEALRISTTGLLQLAGTTNSFPALKRSGAGIQVRLADDSNYGAFTALSLTVPADADTGFLALGVNPSSSGNIRLPANSVGIQCRNNANNANVGVFTSDGSDNVILGFSNAASVIFKPINVESARVTQFGIQLTTTSAYYWNGRSVLLSPSDGVIQISNNTQTDFSRLTFGGASASFPALKRSTTVLEFRLADDSGYTNLKCATSTATGDHISGASSYFFWTGRSTMQSESDGTILIANNGVTDFDRLKFGGASSSFPALKRSSADLSVRLADDSGDANLLAKSVRGVPVTFANVPGTPVHGMLVAVTDSTTTTWGATITGGGANKVIAGYNGTNWTVVGI